MSIVTGIDDNALRMRNRKRELAIFLQRWGVFIGLIMLVIIFSLSSPHFLNSRNLLNIARQTSINAIIAVGMTYVIITAGIDLSVGSVLGLSTVVVATLITELGIPAVPAIILTLLVGMTIGGTVGFSVAYLKIPPFIITLAYMTIARGLALLITGGYPVHLDSGVLHFLGRGFVFGIPTPVIVMAIIYLLGWFTLARTKLGRHIYAVGGNYQTARLSGIRVKLVLVFVYVLTGALAALSGVLLAGRLSSGVPNSGVMFELHIIAATILGGTSFVGGEGTVLGTLIGALLMGILSNGLNILNVSPYVQQIVQGLVIFGAVYLSVFSSRNQTD